MQKTKSSPILSPSPNIDIVPTEELSNNLLVQTIETDRNPFFFLNDVSKARYKSRFTFFSEDTLPNEMELLVTEVLNFENGILYELRLDYDKDFDNRHLFGWDRFQLGYFYVQKDKIIMIRGINVLDKIKSEEDIFKECNIVCQEKEHNDALGENEKGWHEYILADGNRREYHGYNTLTETGFYEMFIWEEGKGLVEYKSGFGAEKDDIELQLITTDQGR
jgi:hypothetical protein